MRPVPLTALLACTGALLAGMPPSPGLCFRGISTDSRTVRPDELYVALKGTNHDGHDFLDAALQAGASAVCASDPFRLAAALSRFPERSVAALLVDDTLAAYQRIAAWYRTTLPARIFAVTGSVGKTTTRDLVAAALRPERAVHRTSANLNNEIGLPKTLLEADEGHEIVVLEMGMRARGEIALLSRIAAPDAAAVTNIGSAHIEFLGSREAILAAKMEIVQGLRADGSLFLNLDDPLLAGYAAGLPATGILPETGRRAKVVALRTEASADAPVPPGCAATFLARRIRIGQDGVRFDASWSDGEGRGTRTDVFVPTPGLHAVQNALFGLAAAAWAGVSPDAAVAGLAAFEPTGARMKVRDFGRLVLIDDSYNASPESMEAAFAVQRAIASGRRTLAALGGMNELGPHAEAAHRLTGAAAAKAGVSIALVTGPFAGAFAEGFRSVAAPAAEAQCVSDAREMAGRLLPMLQDGDVLLVKGSRAFGMEKVSQDVAARFDGPKEESR